MSNIAEDKNKYILMLKWLAPSLLEMAIYLFVVLLTLFFSSQEFIKQSLFVSGDFNPIQAGIDSIDVLLQNIVGEQIAGSLSLAIFWGLVGVAVNMFWWLGSNFSSELSNDLVFSKYVHPKDSDPRSPLREFIEKTIFRTAAAIIALIYSNLFISDLLPRITTRMSYFIENWSISKEWLSLLLAIVSQLILLHIFTILVKLVLLKKDIL